MFVMNPTNEFMNKNNFNTIPNDSSYESTYMVQDAKVMVKENFLVKYAYNIIEVYYLADLIYQITEDSYIVGAYIQYTINTQYLLIIKQNSQFYIRHLRTGIILKTQNFPNIQIYNYQLSIDTKIITFFGYKFDDYSVIHVSAWNLDDNMSLIGQSNGVTQCKGLFLKMEIPASNSLMLIVCNLSFSFMKINSNMDLLSNKVYSKTLYSGFIDEDLKLLCFFGNTDRIFIDIYYYVLPTVSGNQATLTTNSTLTFPAIFTQGFIVLQTDQKRMTMFNPSRLDVFHYFYKRKVYKNQNLFIQYNTVIMTSTNYMVAYGKSDFKEFYSYFTTASVYGEGITNQGSFSINNNYNINIYGIFYDISAKLFYCSASGNQLFLFSLTTKTSDMLFTTDQQFYEIFVDKNQIYSISNTDSTNNILSARFNTTYNQLVQYNMANFPYSNYTDICFNYNRTNALIITNVTAVITSVINLKIVKTLGDSTFSNVISCFATNNYFGVLYQQGNTNSQIALYTQDPQFTFLGMINPTNNKIITYFAILQTQVLFISNGLIYSINLLDQMKEDQPNSLSGDTNLDGPMIKLIPFFNNFYVLYKYSLILYQSDLTVVSILRINKFNQQQGTQQSKLLLQTPVLINLQNNFAKVSLDREHKFVWIESDTGEILVHESISFKQVLYLNHQKKFSFISHTAVFTKNDALICWLNKCIHFDYIQSNANGIIEYSLSSDTFIEIELDSSKSISVYQIKYDEMTQNLILCSKDSEFMYLNSKSGSLVKKISNLSSKNVCQGLIVDIMYNRIYFLGRTLLLIYDLSYLYLQSISQTYLDQQYLRKPFPLSFQSDTEDIQNLYIPNRDFVVKVYDMNKQTYEEPIYIPNLKNLIPFRDNLLVGKTENQLYLIDILTQDIKSNTTFNTILQLEVVTFNNTKNILIVYDKDKIRLLDFDNSYQVQQNLIINAGNLITMVQTDGVMMVAADYQNNLYDINIGFQNFTQIKATVSSNSPVSSLVVNGKHQILVVIYDGFRAEFYSRSGNLQLPLSRVSALTISESFKITSTVTNQANGTARSCFYEEARQLVFVLSQNIGRLFIFQYQSDFTKIAAFSLLNVPARQTKNIYLKVFSEIKTIAIITNYQIDFLNQETLYPYQIFREQKFIQITNFHFQIFKNQNNQDYLGFLSTTSNLFIFQFDQTIQQFVQIKSFPIEKVEFISAIIRAQNGGIQKLQIVGFSNLGNVFSILTSLSIFQERIDKDKIEKINEQCVIQILNPSYAYIQYMFNSLQAGRLLLDNQNEIQKYRIVFKDGLYNQINFQLPDFSQDYSLDFIGNQFEALKITNDYLNYFNPVEFYLENLQIVSDNNTQVIFNNKNRNTNLNRIANITFQSVTFNTENSVTQFVFSDFQNIQFNQTLFLMQKTIQNMSYILVNNSQNVNLQNTNISNINLVGSTFIHIVGADIENQKELFETTKVLIENFNFYRIKLIDSNILHFEMIKQINLNSFNFTNCQTFKGSKQTNYSILTKLSGVYQVQVTSVNFINNFDVQLILYSPTYQDQKYQNIQIEKTLKSQSITLSQSFFTQNIIKSIPVSLVYINAKYLEVVSLNFQENQVSELQSVQLNSRQTAQKQVYNEVDGETSILSVFGSQNFIVRKSNFTSNKASSGGSLNIQNTQSFVIEDSNFLNNAAFINGGALFIYNDEQFKFYQQTFQNKIIKSLFQGNSATVGGGAIYSKRTNYTLYNSIIQENQSSIGGAIRCLDRTPPYPDAFTSSIQSDLRKLTSDYYNNIVQNNKATIFGQNFGSFPLAIKSDNQIVGSDIIYQNFRSGDIINNLSLQLLDEEFNPVKLQQKSTGVTSNSEQIIIQLQNGNAKAFSEDIFLKEQLAAKYDYDKFQFTNLQVIGVPGEDQYLYIQIPSLKVFNNSQDTFLQSPPLKIKIQFRKCITGEIFESVCPDCKQKACRVCEEGTYSLLDPNIQQVNACKLCPFEQAQYCKLNKINLKPGYWRKSIQTDEIFYCENSPENCYGKEENNYCVEGFTGPLCETCDIEKKNWDQKYGSVSNKINECMKCSEIKEGIYSIVLPFIGVFIYIMFSINKISSMAQQYLYAIYLRKCHILAVGTSGQADKFSLYSKIFMNFLQISMSILQMKISIPTQIYTLFNIIGDPISTSQFSLDCYLDILPFSFPAAYYRIIWSQIIPIALFIFLMIGYFILVLVRCFKFEKKFIYSMLLMLLIFMQTGIAQILFKSISCRQFGNSGSYMLSQLTEECWTPSHILFTLALTIPAIIIWIIIVPLIFFSRIYAASKNKKLDRFQTVQRYGYLYQEYRQNKFYWEFVKMYQRVFITLSLVQFNNYPIEQGFCISLIILLYIYLSYTHKPYLNQQINLIDQRSSLAQIIIILLATLYNSSNQYVNKQWILFLLFGIQLLFIFYMCILLAKDCIQTNNSYFITLIKSKTISKFPYLQKYFKSFSENPWKKLANWQVLRLNTHFWLISKRSNSQIQWNEFLEKRSKDLKSICQQISSISKNRCNNMSNDLLKNSSYKNKSDMQDMQQNSNQKMSLYSIRNEPYQEMKNFINQKSSMQIESNPQFSIQKDSNQQVDNQDDVSHISFVSQLIPSEIRMNTDNGGTQKQIYKPEYFNDQNNEFALPVLRESDVFPSYINRLQKQINLINQNTKEKEKAKVNENIKEDDQIDELKSCQIDELISNKIERHQSDFTEEKLNTILVDEQKNNSVKEEKDNQVEEKIINQISNSGNNQIEESESNQDNQLIDLQSSLGEEFQNEKNEKQIQFDFIKNQNVIKRHKTNVPVIPLQFIVNDENEDSPQNYNQIYLQNMMELQKISLNNLDHEQQNSQYENEEVATKQDNEVSDILQISDKQDNGQEQNLKGSKDKQEEKEKIEQDIEDEQAFDFVLLSNDVEDIQKNSIKINEYLQNYQQQTVKQPQVEEQPKQNDSLKDLDVFIDVENLSKNIINYRNQIKQQDLFNNLITSKASEQVHDQNI